MARQPDCEVVLVRHAHSTANLKGVLAGRDNRIGLSPRGKREAGELASLLAREEFDVIYSSPLRRCRETIAPLLELKEQKVEFLDDLIEMEYGNWSGKLLAVLAKEELWKVIQTRPSTVRFPGGESFFEMSLRANQAVLARSVGRRRILIISHGDVIKAIVAFHLGLNLDLFQRISVDPASITTIRIPNSHVIQVNSISHLSKEENRGNVKRDRFSLGGGQGKV